MILIFGLGNPERDYKGTRHNVGFEVINKLAYDHNIDINRAKFRAHMGEGKIADKRVILLKPQTYMNLSGECVRDAINFFKLTASEIIVIHDDADLPPGRVRIRERGSAGGHNGIKNIIYQLESDEFLRIKIGIGKPERADAHDITGKRSVGKGSMVDFVTGRFSKSEMDNMIDGITKAGDAVEMILTKGAQSAMNIYNRVEKETDKKEIPSIERIN